jgi:hypothetical protein
MAYQSSPDMAASYGALANPPNLMSLYTQMYERDRADDQFNRGLAIIAANHSSPEMARAIMGSVGNSDPSAMVGNLISLNQTQQQMAGQQGLLAQAPAIAAKLNMDPAVVRSEILAGRGPDLVKALEPTTTERDIQGKHDIFIKSAIAQGQSPADAEADWNKNQLPFILNAGMGGDAATQSWRNEKIIWNQQNPGKPVPWGNDDPQSFALWKAQQDQLTKDQTEAMDKRTGYTQNLTDVRNGIGSIIGLKPGGNPNNPDDYDPTQVAKLKHALNADGAQAYLSGDPKDWTTQNVTGALLSPEDKAVLDKIREASDPKQLLGTLGTRAPKRGVSDVNAIGQGLGGLGNVRKPYDDWLNGAKSTIISTDTATGNAFGASGHAEDAPDYTKPLIDPAYLQGGSMYPFGKKPTPMSPDQVAQATAKIKAAQDPAAERQILIKVARANNIDTTPLQNAGG